MRYIVQAIFALAVLVVLPLFVDTPATEEGMIGATIGALVLAYVALRGVLGYVASRKPKSYHDSVMPPVENNPRK